MERRRVAVVPRVHVRSRAEQHLERSDVTLGRRPVRRSVAYDLVGRAGAGEGQQLRLRCEELLELRGLAHLGREEPGLS